MDKVYQLCRVCGVQIPSGFTNCDECYAKPSEADSDDAEKRKRTKKAA